MSAARLCQLTRRVVVFGVMSHWMDGCGFLSQLSGATRQGDGQAQYFRVLRRNVVEEIIHLDGYFEERRLKDLVKKP